MHCEDYQYTIKQAREKYKPAKIKCLFIAEAPPDEMSRFFYYADVKTADYLFLGIINCLYPELKKKYISEKRPASVKELILRRFQEDGYYLLDLLEFPKSKYPNKDLLNAAPDLISRVAATIDKDVPIVLIKANVYKILAPVLKEQGYNVIEEQINFPSSGQQKNFAESFKVAIDKAQTSTIG